MQWIVFCTLIIFYFIVVASIAINECHPDKYNVMREISCISGNCFSLFNEGADR